MRLASRFALIVLCTVFSPCPLLANEPASHSRRSPVVEAVRKTRPSIVTVRVPRPGGGKDLIGSGVIVDERGFVVTNRHVVSANRRVTVCLADESELSGEVVFAEARYDLAVVRVRAGRPLPALPLAPASDLMVGETVIAVGHPFGYTNTVSTGIISALGREVTMPTGETITGLIQTDASINPGNSGGPLLNVNGELIGINMALREGAQGIAFSINAGMVRQVLADHLSAAKIAGVDHGLRCEDKVLAEAGDRQRVVVLEAQGPVHEGDEIVAIGARRIGNGFDLERALWDKRPGQQVALQVVRDGREMTVALTLATRPETSQAAVTPEPVRTVPRAATGTPAGARR